MCFKQFYELLEKDLELEKLSPEPEIIPYDDNTFAINWWPHYIFQTDSRLIAEHKSFAENNGTEEEHKSYLGNQEDQLTKLQDKIKSLLKNRSGTCQCE